MRYFITYLKNGREYVHNHAPDNRDEALRMGQELVRDFVADFFRIDGVRR